MLDHRSHSWFYPKPTGDVGRDRNARTLQFSCLLFAVVLGAIAIVNTISGEAIPLPILVSGAGLVAAAAMNRAGWSAVAGRIIILAMMVGAVWLVVEAHDGVRSHAMLVFPGLLLISVMLLDRRSYLTTAGVILLAVAALAIAERQGLTKAIPGFRSPTTYDSIFYIELILAVFAMIGSRVASDVQKDIFDLRGSVDQLSSANLELTMATTSLRRTEALARRRAAELQAIMDAAPAAILVAHDVGGRHISGNRMAHVLLRQEPGSNFSMTAPDGERPTNHRLMRGGLEIPAQELPVQQAALTGQSFRNYDLEAVFEDGTYVDLSGNVEPMLDENGEAQGAVAVLSDITEPKRAETKLRESEERFRRVFEEGPLGLALVGRDHRYLKVNNALCQLVGYTEDELLQKTFRDITHPEDVQMDVELAERLFRRDIPFYRMQKRYLKKTGEIIWINLTASMILGSNGEPIYGLAMVEDITDIKRNQEELLAKQRLESVGTLASGIAHDFNNILGAVLTQAEVAMAELDSGTSPVGELRAICAVAVRGSEIVRELMIYAGKESPVTGFVSLSQIVEEMLELLRVSVSKHATLATDLDRHLPPVRANTSQISQVVMNLVTNASEAIGDRNGTIRLSTRRVIVEHDSSLMNRLPAGEYLQLEVADTGCGMSPETRARVMDPFFSTKAPGRGLGLAVVHGIIRSLDGEIHLTSEPGRGTTVQILLPYVEATAGTICEPTSHINSLTQPRNAITILVVDDEDPLRQAAVKMLRKQGFSVLEARDGLAALDAIRTLRNAIHVLFLDITLPGAPSREVLSEARRLRPEMKVISTSAYTEAMTTGSLEGATERFIRKPYRFSEVVDLIHEVLS